MAAHSLVLLYFLGSLVLQEGDKYWVRRGVQIFEGTVDHFGEFVPRTVRGRDVGMDLVHLDLERARNGCDLLEYRSGTIVYGRFMNSVYVPAAGTKVLAYERGVLPGLDIYNLPHELAERSSRFCERIRGGKERAPLYTARDHEKFRLAVSRVSGSVFVQDLTPRVHHKWGDKVYVGNLDTHGRFIPDPYVPPQEPEKFAGIVPTSRPLMVGPDGRREVYEFRAGRLVPGKLTDDDRFIPEVGGLIIHIRDYVYTPEARPIYNLPGQFYPKGMKINVAGREVPVEKIGNRWSLYPR